VPSRGPPPAVQAIVNSGSSSIVLDAVTYGSTPISSGDILLVIQMQGSQINATNTSSYGSGTGTGSGYLSNSSLLDFETTPSFTLNVLVTDAGQLTDTAVITINLTNVNESPTISVPAAASVPENTTTVATVTANDPDAGTTLIFSLSGADAAKFQLTGTGSTRTLSFVNAPDFETPTDVGGNNVYDVTVMVSDGTLSDSKAIAVTVTDVNEGGQTPFIIRGTDKSDKITVKECGNGWLTVTVNDETSRVQLQHGQELQVLGLGGNDHIVLEGLNRNALIDGGDGNDKIDGHNVTKLPMYQRARLGIGYLPQEASIFRGLTVEQNIRAVLEVVEPSKKKREHELDSLLQEFNITKLRKTPSIALSGGERRRVEITRALVISPAFMLLDEPFAGIDPLAVVDIQGIVDQLKRRGIGVLITDHNVRETLGICDRAYILNDGAVLEEGAPARIAASPLAREIYLGEKFRL